MEMDEKFIAELNKAERSRRAGNDGMARVCARRAVGLAVRWYLTKTGHDRPDLNNFEILFEPTIRDCLPVETHPWLDHLSMRVDINHELPAGIDLVADARNVMQLLRQDGE